jgi:predicted  nucleic acid-binding Zn-ribbon protein
MAMEHNQSPDVDLDKTDRLPILDGTLFDHDVEDDAVPMDRTAVLPGLSRVAAAGPPVEFRRPPGVDLPSLAESVRSVEERIARQSADYETLSRAHESALDAEVVAAAHAKALAADLAAARSALEAEQSRSRELDRALTERSGSVESARTRIEEAVRESERLQGESRALRDSLAARDATIVQVLHSLGERDAQLTALQSEHARLVPAFEANSKSTTQLEADLQAARAQGAALAKELEASRKAAGALGARVARAESEVKATRSELGSVKTQANSYLELLRTREWRRGFDENLFRDLDARAGAARAGHDALEAARDRLRDQVGALEAQLAAQQAAATIERSGLAEQLAARDRAIAQAQEKCAGSARKVEELIVAAARAQADQRAETAKLEKEHAEQAAQWQSDMETRDQEAAVLMAHLQEARRPIQSIEADVRRLKDELAAKSAAYDEMAEENRKLQAALERTRGALEEREFLIRRLERSESNNANVLGRIQTSIERLGSVPVGQTAGATVPSAEWSAELIRIDGDRATTHVLSRRTRIGRASGCELQIDSSSVSRHHALVLVGPRDAIIEDLNSTNGVIVNGRKVTRQLLSDGDAVTIGEVQFRYLARHVPRAQSAPPAEPAPRE